MVVVRSQYPPWPRSHDCRPAAGVKTGETIAEIEVTRFAEMARLYAQLSPADKRSLEAFIAALEHALKTAVTK